eukprot:gene6266-12685_t
MSSKLKRRLSKDPKKVTTLLTLPTVQPPPQYSTRTQTVNNLIQTNDVRTLSRMITHYGYDNDLQSCGFAGSTPLHQAAKVGDISIAHLLLSQNKIDINKLEDSRTGGCAAIHYACTEGHSKILELLLQHGANANIKTNTSFGDSPLHFCCKLGQVTCAKILLNHGADPNIRDKLGHNPSFWAYSRRHDHMIKDLGLPPSASPTADEFVEMIRNNNATSGKLPSMKKKKKKVPKKKKSTSI